ncbi:hypothetical protein [Micromonospora qiuiae]|uniref:hypothetical protein n=1 Tax=Micromonospora qiuiae TaxID=502268 RepID=UPI001EF31AB1|nr:hypothetical protein [Micromonospora qiuiae]
MVFAAIRWRCQLDRADLHVSTARGWLCAKRTCRALLLQCSSDAGLSGRHPEFRLTFADARHPRTLLHEVAERIGTDIAYWRGEGVAVAAVTPRADGSGIKVMVDRVGAELAAAMRERYEFPDLEFAVGEITPA